LPTLPAFCWRYGSNASKMLALREILMQKFPKYSSTKLFEPAAWAGRAITVKSI
jgi:hypothetical protein